MKDKDFSTWLEAEEVDGDLVAKCKICNHVFKKPNKNDLKKHTDTAKHRGIVAENAVTLDLTTFIKKKFLDVSKSTARAEVKIVGFLAEMQSQKT